MQIRCCLGLWVLMAAPAFAAPAVSPVPPDVRARLDEQYPGWKLATAAKSVWLVFKSTAVPLPPSRHPSLLNADFDGDGKKDWAIQIQLSNPGEEEQFVTVFLARDGGYEEAIVESRGPDPQVFLWTDVQTSSETVSGRDQLVSHRRLLIKGGPIGDSAYLWEGGQFREVPVSIPDATSADVSFPR